MLFFSAKNFGQHFSNIVADLNTEKKTLSVYQELTYYNQSNDTLSFIVLNDWINAYSKKNSPLGKKFSDEFTKNFLLSNEKSQGNTSNIVVFDQDKVLLSWDRPNDGIDLLKINLKNKIFPNQKTTITLTYVLKIPKDDFTKIGYTGNNEFNLKNWLITPTRYNNETHSFCYYNNLNLDDAANAVFDCELKLYTSSNYEITSNLNEEKKIDNTTIFKGNKLFDITLYIENKKTFILFKNDKIEVYNNIDDNKVNDIQKAVIVDRITNYVQENLGSSNQKKITISQIDYEKNPFYGLNQLPSFISPFPNDFLYEIKFLKTYLNNYLKTNLQLDPRKDNWIFDALQVYYMMKYIDEYYGDAKMMGDFSKFKLLKPYKLINLDFNEQYSYYYLLMARKNLDQPLSFSKDQLIKFNEKIASKYRAGLSLKYLSEYVGVESLQKSITSFINYSSENQSNNQDFYSFIQSNTTKNINWFKDVIINSREIIDYKFGNFSKTKDSISFKLINKTNTQVPIPIYGLRKNKIVFKEWLDAVKPDSIYSFKRNNIDKVVINYENIVPEFNQRNNWKSLNSLRITNKPIKFILIRDLEDPFYNQIIYTPTIGFNLYDGILFGIRFQNKTLLEKPFNFALNPSFSSKSRSLTGSGNIYVNQFYRNTALYNARFGFAGNYFHYAPDAYYQKYNPYINLFFRNSDYRDNTQKSILIRQVYVDREKSAFVANQFEGKYSVFNTRFSIFKNELKQLTALSTDIQLASKFGKVSTEVNYRKLFENNKQLTLRLYSGIFIYKNTTSNYFDFALDRPTDYLFDYQYYGRSESTGFFSQQFILAEGGFKSKFSQQNANQWITTLNTGINVWNWIELYGDIGFIKSKNSSEKFVYDNGVRLNLVTDYFEVYLPVYSNNGWEIAQKNYQEKIRFIITISPKILSNLFKRKWF